LALNDADVAKIEDDNAMMWEDEKGSRFASCSSFDDVTTIWKESGI
jgi:hypothetical protein